MFFCMSHVLYHQNAPGDELCMHAFAYIYALGEMSTICVGCKKVGTAYLWAASACVCKCIYICV